MNQSLKVTMSLNKKGTLMVSPNQIIMVIQTLVVIQRLKVVQPLKVALVAPGIFKIYSTKAKEGVEENKQQSRHQCN
jgi:hypothetical protein